ncbi:MAG TPA: hypothetical protein VFR49_00080 [Solirubrobacteraceae bacterium]|nr:hypothetical protein [Solirubrobacteraceae bacterium]
MPDPPSQVPDEPLAEVGREPLREAIASARHDRRGGISVGTLGVAAAASAAASYTASHVWGSGTVLSAALTPVIVALVSEFLRRPVDRVAATAQRVAPIVPRTPPGAAGAPDRRPPAPARDETQDWSPVTYETTPSPGWRPRWRLVLATGLLAFVIVVAVYTVPDLLVGHSITGAGGSTTFFSGGAQNTPLVTTPTVSTPTTTTTQTVTVPTTTVTAPATVTVTTAAPPASTSPTTSTPTTTTTTQTTSTGAAPPAVP